MKYTGLKLHSLLCTKRSTSIPPSKQSTLDTDKFEKLSKKKNMVEKFSSIYLFYCITLGVEQKQQLKVKLI